MCFCIPMWKKGESIGMKTCRTFFFVCTCVHVAMRMCTLWANVKPAHCEFKGNKFSLAGSNTLVLCNQ